MLISEKLQELSFIENQHLFALNTDGSYFEFILHEDETQTQYEVKQLTSNPLLLAAVIVSLVFAIYCVYAILSLLWIFRRLVLVVLDDFMERSRRFSRAKKEIQHKNDPGKQHRVDHKKSQKPIKYLQVNLFSFKIIKEVFLNLK